MYFKWHDEFIEQSCLPLTYSISRWDVSVLTVTAGKVCVCVQEATENAKRRNLTCCNCSVVNMFSVRGGGSVAPVYVCACVCAHVCTCVQVSGMCTAKSEKTKGQVLGGREKRKKLERSLSQNSNRKKTKLSCLTCHEG